MRPLSCAIFLKGNGHFRAEGKVLNKIALGGPLELIQTICYEFADVTCFILIKIVSICILSWRAELMSISVVDSFKISFSSYLSMMED